MTPKGAGAAELKVPHGSLAPVAFVFTTLILVAILRSNVTLGYCLGKGNRRTFIWQAVESDNGFLATCRHTMHR